MSKKISRRQLQNILLNEFKMIGMSPMGGIGHMKSLVDDDGCGDHEDVHQGHSGTHKGVVSKEDCCAAVMCLIECCSCPRTRQILSDACNQLLRS